MEGSIAEGLVRERVGQACVVSTLLWKAFKHYMRTLISDNPFHSNHFFVLLPCVYRVCLVSPLRFKTEATPEPTVARLAPMCKTSFTPRRDQQQQQHNN